MAIDAISKALLAATKVPSSKLIAEAALKSYLEENALDEASIKSCFSDIITDVQIRAFEKYSEHESRLGGAAIDRVLAEISRTTGKTFRRSLKENFYGLDRYFLSLTQSRRSRAGTAFEVIITSLFDRLGYPHTSKPALGASTPDFVLPSLNYYRKNAQDCIVLTCKRSLRERWRQIVTEGIPGRSFYLGTIDPGLTKPELDRMRVQNVVVLVPKKLKSERYLAAVNVIPFEQFFEDHLDPAVIRWKRNGAI